MAVPATTNLENASTLAEQASAKLESSYVQVADNGFWNSYDHVLICHGCGHFHVVRSQFIGSSLSIGFSFLDGSSLSIPAYKCSNCPGEAIRDAWQNGMHRSAYNRAAFEIGFGAKLSPEPIPCRLCSAPGYVGRQLDETGVHNLCAARAARGLDTPALEGARA